MRIPPLTTHNLDLVKASYPLCVITVENLLAYYISTRSINGLQKTEASVQLVSDAVLEGFKPYQVF